MKTVSLSPMSDHIKVAEAPGLYGTFSVEEKLIQQLWKNGDFMTNDLHTTGGKSLKIIDFGKWNLAEEGPDFKEARISIDGQEFAGDIEVHFEEKDWKAHGHDQDPAYARVILHVVLFPSKGKASRALSDKNERIPTLVLLPFLFQSLEEYAEEVAMEKLADLSTKLKMPDHFPQSWDESRNWARKRWYQKCQHAETRLKNSKWKDACHQWFIEVLGYRRNRTPMARISQLFPLEAWQAGLNPDEIYSTQKDWKLRGCRPANHPQKRLQQYAQLMNKSPAWIISLQKMDFVKDSSIKSESGISRRSLQIKKIEDEWAQNILAGIFGGTRVHTLMIDACLPLWSVYRGENSFETWYHWSCGDMPAVFRKWSQQASLHNHSRPYCNGLAQAILGASLQR